MGQCPDGKLNNRRGHLAGPVGGAGSRSAEDLVQEVWLRWQTCDRATVLNPGAFLATTTTPLAINALQVSAVLGRMHPSRGVAGIDWIADLVAYTVSSPRHVNLRQLGRHAGPGKA
jgi:DNA-directed RNA polymerase specialized sigma24 family protein